MRLVVGVLAAVLVAVAMAPASLIDRAGQALSHGHVRVGSAEGTIWHGRGVIEVADSATKSWTLWRQVQWSLDIPAIFGGWLAWRLSVEGAESSQLAFGPSRWRVTNLTMVGPARYLVQHFANPLAKLGWQGDLRLATPSLECSWQGICDGHLSAHWLNAGCDCLPEQVFGDYAIEAVANAGRVRFDLTTVAGAIRVTGSGGFSTEKPLSLDATVSGDPLVLSRLPAVASPWATPTEDPGIWNIHF